MIPELLAAEWPRLALLALIGAWLALDDTAYWQTWLSQPLPAAILAGLACGAVGNGLAVGLPVQVLAIGHLPVGQSAAGERTTPVIAAVGASWLAGSELPRLPGGTGDGAAATGWLLLAVALIALSGYRLVRSERALHKRWMLSALRGLRRGRLEGIDSAQRRCLAATALRGAAGTLVWTLAVGLLWLPLLQGMPPWALAGLAAVPLLAVPLGACALVEVYGARSGLTWMLGGFAAALVCGWWLT